jgi:hypothetical protein
MNQFDGAFLKDAFKIIGQGSTKPAKAVDKQEPPRDKEPNDLNKINFEENIKYIINRYDKIINELINEVNSLKKNVTTSHNKKSLQPKKKLIEGYTSDSKPFMSENQVNELIFLLFCGIIIICLLNFIL